MKDIQGVDRGKCTKCGDCAEYTTDGGGSVRCTMCDHAPTQHEVKGASSQLEVHSERRQLSRPSRPASAGPAFQRATRVTANYEVCTFPGCSQPVEFDLNTGKQWDRCSAHKDAPISSLACVMSSFGLNGAQIGGKCSIIIIYSNDVMTHAHAGLPPMQLPSFHPLASLSLPSFAPAPTPTPPLPPLLPPGARKCAIPECTKPCFMDPSGTMHECCGYTHAMEHQRRQALQQRECMLDTMKL